MDTHVLKGRAYVSGSASGLLLATDVELSFWGGVDSSTGEVIDRFHPLSGRSLSNVVLAMPAGRGSCTGSAVILELILNGLGPRALIFQRRDDIITLGVFAAEEIFGKTMPAVVLDPVDFGRVLGWEGKTVHVLNGHVSDAPLSEVSRLVTSPLDSKNLPIQLSSWDAEALEGVHGEATKLAMKIIVRVANILGANELMDVSQAHMDANYYGPGSVAFARRLRDAGGRFRVPTTLNAVGIDQNRWQSLGVDPALGSFCEELMQAYVGMGASASSFTCAPYQLKSIPPRLGDVVAWGESNAVMYANSVLGARTLKYPNMLDCLVALTGRAPRAGLYLDEHRAAVLEIEATAIPEADDAFWPIIGYVIGAEAASRIPVITGLEELKPSLDDLKAFSAAFATAASAPMFHMVNVTPEAPTVEATYYNREPASEVLHISKSVIRDRWSRLSNGPWPRQVDLVSLGSPHFSVKEMMALAELCKGKTKNQDTAVVVTCSRSQYKLATQAGYVEELKSFGVQFLADTCWCFIGEPIVAKPVEVVMTNSAKYRHYGPGLTGKQFCFGSLSMCVEAACSGRSNGNLPLWLEEDPNNQ